MKIKIHMVWMVLSYLYVPAQTQEMKQLQLDIEKLAQQKAMISEMKLGYQVLQSGYNKVTDLSKRNFEQHKSFLDEQLRVSPVVANDPVIKQVLHEHSLVISECQSAYQQYEQSGLFKSRELLVIKAAYKDLTDRCTHDIDQLLRVIQEGALRMSDGEREKMISQAESNMAGSLQSLRSLNSKNNTLLAMRAQARKDYTDLKVLNGLQ